MFVMENQRDKNTKQENSFLTIFFNQTDLVYKCPYVY